MISDNFDYLRFATLGHSPNNAKSAIFVHEHRQGQYAKNSADKIRPCPDWALRSHTWHALANVATACFSCAPACFGRRRDVCGKSCTHGPRQLLTNWAPKKATSRNGSFAYSATGLRSTRTDSNDSYLCRCCTCSFSGPSTPDCFGVSLHHLAPTSFAKMPAAASKSHPGHVRLSMADRAQHLPPLHVLSYGGPSTQTQWLPLVQPCQVACQSQPSRQHGSFPRVEFRCLNYYMPFHSVHNPPTSSAMFVVCFGLGIWQVRVEIGQGLAHIGEFGPWRRIGPKWPQNGQIGHNSPRLGRTSATSGQLLDNFEARWSGVGRLSGTRGGQLFGNLEYVRSASADVSDIGTKAGGVRSRLLRPSLSHSLQAARIALGCVRPPCPIGSAGR